MSICLTLIHYKRNKSLQYVVIGHVCLCKLLIHRDISSGVKIRCATSAVSKFLFIFCTPKINRWICRCCVNQREKSLNTETWWAASWHDKVEVVVENKCLSVHMDKKLDWRWNSNEMMFTRMDCISWASIGPPGFEARCCRCITCQFWKMFFLLNKLMKKVVFSGLLLEHIQTIVYRRIQHKIKYIMDSPDHPCHQTVNTTGESSLRGFFRSTGLQTSTIIWRNFNNMSFSNTIEWASTVCMLSFIHICYCGDSQKQRFLISKCTYCWCTCSYTHLVIQGINISRKKCQRMDLLRSNHLKAIWSVLRWGRNSTKYNSSH